MVEPEKSKVAEVAFLDLYLPNQHRIMSYLLALVGDRNVAEDLLQETATTLWTKFDSFEEGSDFVAWSCTIAFWKVKNYRRTVAKLKVAFSDDLIEQISDRTVELMSNLKDRREALETCLRRLDERDRAFLMARYEPGGNVSRAAEVAGRSIQAAYKSLHRLRNALRDCVSLQVATDT